MRIFSIRKGLEIDSSETDYIYEAYIEALHRNVPLTSIITSFTDHLYYYHSGLCEDLGSLDQEAYNKIIEYLSDSQTIDTLIATLKDCFNDQFIDYTLESFTIINENKKSLKVFHNQSSIFDLFKKDSQLVLFADTIGVRIGDFRDQKIEDELFFNGEKYTIKTKKEKLAFFILVSLFYYENDNKIWELEGICIFSNEFIRENFKNEMDEVFNIQELSDFKHSSNEFICINILDDIGIEKIVSLNEKFFSSLDYVSLKNLFSDQQHFYVVIFEFLMESLGDTSSMGYKESLEAIQNIIEDKISEATELMKKRKQKEISILNEEERKKYYDLLKKIYEHPGYYFYQIWHVENIDQIVKDVLNLFDTHIPIIDFKKSESIVKKIIEKIIDYNLTIGRTKDAIVYSINSKNFFKAAELYKQEKLVDFSYGMMYRNEGGLHFPTRSILTKKEISAVPITMDIYPHDKQTVNVAMIQISFKKEEFKQCENSCEFFIKKEKEEEIYSIFQKVFKKLKNEKVDIIVFPELAISFNLNSKYYFGNKNNPLRELLIEEAFVKKRIIIPGTYYNDRRNTCPVLFPTKEIIHTVKQTLSDLEDAPLRDYAIIKGLCTPVFNTNFGSFTILICRDLLNDSLLSEILELNPDIIFNPSANSDIERFGTKSSSIVENHDLFIIQPNALNNDNLDYSSTIYSILNDKDIEILRKEYKKDDTHYGVYNSPANENEIVIVSVGLKSKRLSRPSRGDDESNIPLRIRKIINLDDSSGFKELLLK